MPIDLKIPHVGESITEVQISEWLKSEGDTVEKDENVVLIDSEKATFELPAPENGRLIKILHNAGDTVKVGEVIGEIEPATEAAVAAKKPETAEADATDEAKPETVPVAKTKQREETPRPDEDAKKEKAKPAGAGNSGSNQETERRADKASEPAPTTSKTQSKLKPSAGREEEKVPMTMLRKTAARRLVEAKQQMAMLTTFNEVDMSAVQTLREEHQEAFEKRHRTRLGFMSFFVTAAIDALKQFPLLNAKISGNDVIYPNYFDIGVAIGSERGLVVPVLRDAQYLSFAELERAIGDFARRAKDGKLKPEELEGGTFTVTNGGVFGSLFSTPIINPPQSGILGMHAIQERPVAVRGQVVIRPMMYVALTYDHRMVDGREAVLFLRRIKEIIESPARVLIGI